MMQRTTITRRQALEAIRAGAQAAREGVPVTTCPYSAAGDADARVLAAGWVRGYVRALGRNA